MFYLLLSERKSNIQNRYDNNLYINIMISSDCQTMTCTNLDIAKKAKLSFLWLLIFN